MQKTKELLRSNVLFQKTPFFGEFTSESLNEFLDIAKISEVEPGESIFEKGDAGGSIVFLLAGELGVYIKDNNGSEIEVARIAENEFVGEMAIIDETVRMATVRTIRASVVGEITSTDFWRYFQKYPALARNVLWGINQRFRRTNDSFIERIKKEKDELYRFNQELEKQVADKTSELRQKDIEILKLDRIAGIATLAAGVAHEINNPLSFVKSSVGAIKKGVDKIVGTVQYWDDKPLDEGLLKDFKVYLDSINFDRTIESFSGRFERVNNGIKRIITIVDSLRTFSRVDREDVGNLDINSSINEAIDILGTREKKDIKFVKELDDMAPPVQCSTNDINQALLHTMKDGIDAIEEAGTITVKTCYEKEANEVVVEIIDDGIGMSPEIQKRIFNPFFTTKEVGSGTGLGLTITENIIRRHKGNIRIVSQEGEGTTVTITLPVVGVF